MTDIRKLFAANMKFYRTRLGLSQEKLAERISATNDYISRIENAKQFPTAATIERLAAALQVDTPDLFVVTPLKKDWQEEFLSDLICFVEEKLETKRR
jgi:transcriptional regulator with XRE-family HTH domain